MEPRFERSGASFFEMLWSLASPKNDQAARPAHSLPSFGSTWMLAELRRARMSW
jgi:hypothetical protein